MDLYDIKIQKLEVRQQKVLECSLQELITTVL